MRSSVICREVLVVERSELLVEFEDRQRLREVNAGPRCRPLHRDPALAARRLFRHRGLATNGLLLRHRDVLAACSSTVTPPASSAIAV